MIKPFVTLLPAAPARTATLLSHLWADLNASRGFRAG
jgi:hypothetical protein